MTSIVIENWLCHSRSMRLTCQLLFASLLASSLAASSADWIWWEAETARQTVNAKAEIEGPDGLYGRVLSAGGRLKAKSRGGSPMRAAWPVEIPVGKSYHLWVRKSWRHGPFQWRFNENEWQTARRDFPLHDEAFIMKDVGAHWVYLGEVELESGQQRFEIESLDNRGFLDAFLLIDGSFQPAGKLKPGEKSGLADAGYFAFEPDADSFGESPIDLRRLNEAYAGEHGYVRREGDHFVRGDGQPIRFWMTQCGDVIKMKPHMQDQHTRRLAKVGINLARFVLLDYFKTWRQGDTEGFARKLDQLHRGVASFKKQGIYTFFGHLFWDTHVSALSDEDLPGLKKGQQATASLFFNEPLRAKYLDFVEALMAPVNPYTGLSLAEDPAVAIIEVQNESNTLFWTLSRERLPAHTVGLIEAAFGQFAVEKYGHLEAAFAHWGEPREGDDPEGGTAGMLDAWALTSTAPKHTRKRAADQIELLTQAQYDLYAEMKRSFRKMGIRKMVAGSNWKTADPSNLGPLEHYSYTATDMINKNEYFSPKKVENPRYYQVEPGDAFVPITAVSAPEAAGALMAAKPADWPYMVTENNWDEPNIYRTEWPFFVATYGAAAGIDGWNFFAYDTPMWYVGNKTWSINTPEILGQFPAYALMFRRGDVTEGPAAVSEHIPLSSLYEGESIALPEVQYKDEVWKRQLGGDPKVDFQSKLDPKAFFTGPVELHLGAEAHRLETADLDSLIDDAEGVVYNTNDQLEWHYKAGFVRVDTPRSQAAAGFMGKIGPVTLTDVVIDMRNDYGTLAIVSLDGEPLARSESILIQAGTNDKAYNFRLVDEGDGVRRVESMGQHPLNVEKIDASVTLRGKADFQVTVLDELGYPTEGLVESRAVGNALQITLPEDALYVHVFK